ncbi:hypothetical protein J0H58_21695 [bacterium]|nr:hypothetical protein [bacterium]
MPTPPRYLTHDGLTLSIREWASRLRLDVGTIRSRLDRLGWSIAQALTTPADRRFRKGGRPRKNAPRPVPQLRRHKATNPTPPWPSSPPRW